MEAPNPFRVHPRQFLYAARNFADVVTITGTSEFLVHQTGNPMPVHAIAGIYLAAVLQRNFPTNRTKPEFITNALAMAASPTLIDHILASNLEDPKKYIMLGILALGIYALNGLSTPARR